jgi:hypothetical protein
MCRLDKIRQIMGEGCGQMATNCNKTPTFAHFLLDVGGLSQVVVLLPLPMNRLIWHNLGFGQPERKRITLGGI